MIVAQADVSREDQVRETLAEVAPGAPTAQGRDPRGGRAGRRCVVAAELRAISTGHGAQSERGMEPAPRLREAHRSISLSCSRPSPRCSARPARATMRRPTLFAMDWLTIVARWASPALSINWGRVGRDWTRRNARTGWNASGLRQASASLAPRWASKRSSGHWARSADKVAVSTVTAALTLRRGRGRHPSAVRSSLLAQFRQTAKPDTRQVHRASSDHSAPRCWPRSLAASGARRSRHSVPGAGGAGSCVWRLRALICDKPLQTLGMDSLMTIELPNRARDWPSA